MKRTEYHYKFISINIYNIWQVHLPTGARVSIQVQGTSNYHFLNIQVYTATSDVNLTGGLCGKFNRNRNDDFTDPRGQISEEIPFKTSWQWV